MDHYYSAKPTSKKNRKEIELAIDEFDFTLMTDAGVFSKDKIDKGSEVLVKVALETNFPKGNILDLGCGYGAIGLPLAKKFPSRTIEMVDINERALGLSKENAQLNNIKNIEIYQSNVYSSIENQKFGGIISNPPIRAGKKIVHHILEQAYDHLIEDGKLQIVIQRKQGAPSAKKKMKEVFGNVERIALEKGYWVLQSIKEARSEEE